MPKHTSVKWLHKKWIDGLNDGSVQILGTRILFPKEWIKEANEKHEREIIAARSGAPRTIDSTVDGAEEREAKNYYESTFKK